MNNWNPSIYRWKEMLLNRIAVAALGVLFFILLPISISKGCGLFDRSFRGYTFVNPQIVKAPLDFAPFLLDFEEIYDLYDGQEAEQEKGNLEEWYERFCERVTLKDLRYIIYNATLSEIRQLGTATRSKSIPLDYRIAKNSFARHLERHQCHEVIDYLVFAKKCEPHVIPKKDWQESKEGYRSYARTDSGWAEGIPKHG